MISTGGLTHIHLMVKDVHRSLEFYRAVFGMQERFWAGDGLVFLNTPGSKDVIIFPTPRHRAYLSRFRVLLPDSCRCSFAGISCSRSVS